MKLSSLYFHFCCILSAFFTSRFTISHLEPVRSAAQSKIFSRVKLWKKVKTRLKDLHVSYQLVKKNWKGFFFRLTRAIQRGWELATFFKVNFPGLSYEKNPFYVFWGSFGCEKAIDEKIEPQRPKFINVCWSIIQILNFLKIICDFHSQFSKLIPTNLGFCFCNQMY